MVKPENNMKRKSNNSRIWVVLIFLFIAASIFGFPYIAEELERLEMAEEVRERGLELHTAAQSKNIIDEGPFGITMGDPVSKHGCKEVDTEKDEYLCENISRPHPDIEAHWVYSTRSTGIAMIKVRGGDDFSPYYEPDDPERIKTLSSKMANQLSEKYGEWDKRDQNEASWRRGYVWEFDSSERNDGITKIHLHILGLAEWKGMDFGYHFRIDFDFSNKDTWEQERINNRYQQEVDAF